MWLSHHHRENYDRCTVVAGRHVCRRCLWFYPVCFATTLLSLDGVHWPVAYCKWCDVFRPSRDRFHAIRLSLL